MASGGVHSVTLDEAIAAMRMTAEGVLTFRRANKSKPTRSILKTEPFLLDMSHKYKETSLGGLATTVKIPLTSPAWYVVSCYPLVRRPNLTRHAFTCS